MSSVQASFFRLPSLAIVATVLCFTLAGCGDDSEPSTVGAEAVADAPAAAASGTVSVAQAASAPVDLAASAPASTVDLPPMPVGVSHSAMGPRVDASQIPPPAVGHADLRRRTVWSDAAGKPAPACQSAGPNCIVASANVPVAQPNDIGAFRVPCDFARMSYDDPIVYPGQPGRSHLHTFFGNVAVDADTTTESLRARGNSSCAGGIANRSAYWIPTMVDTRTGTPQVPTANIVYYKCSYELPLPVSCGQMQPPPAGLRVVSGDAMNASRTAAKPARYICYGANGENPGWKGDFAAAVATGVCKKGAEFVMEVTFPNCWDGVNLDSPNHASHMAHPEHYTTPAGQQSSRCPTTHPVVLPSISYNIHYRIADDDAVANWRLSSDMYDAQLPGGLSGHGDYFMGWDPEVVKTFVARCDRDQFDCHAYLLGDGTTLY